MILAMAGDGKILGRYNDDGTVYRDPTALGVWDNEPYFPSTTTNPKGSITFNSVATKVVDVLKVLFPTGITKNTATYDPITGTPPPVQQQSSSFSGLGWVVAFVVLMYFLFSGKKKN